LPKHVQFEPGGVGESFDPINGVVTQYTSTCSHCQHITEFPSKRKMMEHVEICRGCMKLICLECVGLPCRPYENEADRQETAFELHKAMVRLGMTGART
jgi:hypothetical protein